MKISDVTVTLFAWDDLPPRQFGRHTGRMAGGRSELGLVTAGGKVVWGRWAQITNNCENDGCVNA